MGDSNTQWKEGQVRKFNGQATVEISRSFKLALLLLVRHNIFEILADCAFWAL